MAEEELSVFKKGEKYQFSKDLADAYKNSLKTSTEQKIFDRIPDYYFWDIKKPNLPFKPFTRKNKHNPFRGREHRDFFEMRATEQYFDSQELMDNLNPSVSTYR